MPCCFRGLSSALVMNSAVRQWLLPLLGAVLLVLGVAACGRSEPPLPATPEEIAESVAWTRSIAMEAASRVERELAATLADDALFDTELMARKLMAVIGVEGVTVNPSGTIISVLQRDGVFHNVIVADPLDARWFSEPAASAAVSAAGLEPSAGTVTAASPEQGRAAIFVGFPGGSLNRFHALPLTGILEAGGFQVDVFTDEDVTLDELRGSFLAAYDLIYFFTHGGVGRTQAGEPTTFLLSRERVSAERTESLTPAERAAVATVSTGSAAYYALTPQWLKETGSELFDGTFVFVNAAEGAQEPEGSVSLAAEFLRLGAGGFAGYGGTVPPAFATDISKVLLARLLQGELLGDAAQALSSDEDLLEVSWRLRLQGAERNGKQDISVLAGAEPAGTSFVLVDPAEQLAVPLMKPEKGRPGSSVAYEVEFKPMVAGRVATVKVNIGNTGQRFELKRSENSITTWRIELWIPETNRYPFVDTFTFTAVDEAGETVAAGTASLTILEPRLGTGGVAGSGFEWYRVR